MIALARSMGLPAKFPGSGGAIFGICDSVKKFRQAQAAFRERGFEFVEVQPANGAAAAKGLFPATIDALPAVYAQV